MDSMGYKHNATHPVIGMNTRAGPVVAWKIVSKTRVKKDIERAPVHSITGLYYLVSDPQYPSSKEEFWDDNLSVQTWV